MTGTVGIIPVRMSSSRFPGKPLAKILGIPMVGHVYFRSAMAPSLGRVYIATCDGPIAEYAARIDAPCIMTGSHHERATDRAAEALAAVERDLGQEVDPVVLIQGDEPMLRPEMIELAVNALRAEPLADVVNLMGPLDPEEHADPNEVKVVVDRAGFALYFSREPIPSPKRSAEGVAAAKQVCIMPFRRRELLRFTSLPPTPLELIESVDMLRFLEHGHRVKMVPISMRTYSVDTPEDLQHVERLMAGDPLVPQYAARAS